MKENGHVSSCGGSGYLPQSSENSRSIGQALAGGRRHGGHSRHTANAGYESGASRTRSLGVQGSGGHERGNYSGHEDQPENSKASLVMFGGIKAHEDDQILGLAEMLQEISE